jgi:hypothetical protein
MSPARYGTDEPPEETGIRSNEEADTGTHSWGHMTEEAPEQPGAREEEADTGTHSYKYGTEEAPEEPGLRGESAEDEPDDTEASSYKI